MTYLKPQGFKYVSCIESETHLTLRVFYTTGSRNAIGRVENIIEIYGSQFMYL